jgi:two-component system, OmpR family, phosphate regulon sensor histidine kinase PhoR
VRPPSDYEAEETARIDHGRTRSEAQERLAVVGGGVASEDLHLLAAVDQAARSSAKILSDPFGRLGEGAALASGVGAAEVVEPSAMLDAFSVGVALISADGELLALNRAAIDLFDLDEGHRPRRAPELLERLAPAWPDGTTIALGETPFQRALRGEIVRDELLSLALGGRARRWVVAGATPLGALGAAHSVVLNVVDVTRSRELEQERAALLRRVFEKFEPGLRGLERAALDLRAGATPATSNERVPEIVRAARRLSASLREVEAALMFETSSIRTQPELVDVRAFVLDLLERNFAGVDARRVVPILPHGLPRALVDPDHLEQMIVELLRGAFAAAPDGRSIVLAADAVGGVRITFTSPGRNFPPAELARLFERFYRQPGRLHLVRSLAEANGGRILADIGGGRGLAVYLVLRVKAG